MANKTIRVQPIQGKFVSVTQNGKTIRIWLVDPYTNEQGTEVSYEDAIVLLSLRHPVVCPAQIKGEDGKFVEQLTEDDWKKIKDLHESNLSKITANTLQETTVVSSDNSALEKLVETQAELIKTQSKQIEDMNKKFSSILSDVEKLKKKSK